jgi:hypothetical protein
MGWRDPGSGRCGGADRGPRVEETQIRHRLAGADLIALGHDVIPRTGRTGRGEAGIRSMRRQSRWKGRRRRGAHLRCAALLGMRDAEGEDLEKGWWWWWWWEILTRFVPAGEEVKQLRKPPGCCSIRNGWLGYEPAGSLFFLSGPWVTDKWDFASYRFFLRRTCY